MSFLNACSKQSILCLTSPSGASSYPSSLTPAGSSASGPHYTLSITVASWLASVPMVLSPSIGSSKAKAYRELFKLPLQSRSLLSSKPLMAHFAQRYHHRAWAGHLLGSVGYLSTPPPFLSRYLKKKKTFYFELGYSWVTQLWWFQVNYLLSFPPVPVTLLDPNGENKV